MTGRIRILATGTMLALSLIGGNALAQSTLLPRNVRLVVPFPPGNAADLQARALADQLRKAHGLTVVVDNRPGASGAIALQHVAAAKADGTTQADTHRYKQCGNGVASPVAQWIAKHILNI